MFRRTLCALAALAGLSLVPSADAHPPGYYRGYPVYRGPVIYGSVGPVLYSNVRVYYRRYPTEPWFVYGSYFDDGLMHATVRMLQSRGYEVMYRVY